jgi:two-component system, cell cycle response regulator
MARPCVLIIDDSKFVRATFSSILKPNFEVREEADGEAGWNAISTDPSIAAVFLDITMPRMDGFGVLGRIRGARDDRIRHLPVIMISGDEDEKTRKRAKDSGANDFITKTADATELLARLDNLLRLVKVAEEVTETREVAAQTATHDPLTGAFTLHYLVTEGRKHHAHARRHGSLLSVISFRIDSHREITDKVGKEVADQLLTRIAKAIQGVLRTEDSLGRAGDDSFAIIMAGTSSQQAAALANRVRDQLTSAQVNFRGQALKIKASIGVAALGEDAAASMEELMRLASSRLGPAAGTVKPAAGPAPAAVKQTPGLPPEIERALQGLERIPAGRASDASNEVIRRLLAIVNALQKRPK